MAIPGGKGEWVIGTIPSRNSVNRAPSAHPGVPPPPRRPVGSLSAMKAKFEPVPLPSLSPGELTADRLDPLLRDWASSPPLRALAAASGWAWPQAPDTASLLTELAGLSKDWDFRARKGTGTERNFIGAESAEVNGRVVGEDLAVAAASALGLVRATPAGAQSFSHLVVLSGLARACVNRTSHAADLLRGGLRAGSTVVLGAHRELGGQEPQQAREQGWGDLFDEADVVAAATRRAFGLGDPEQAAQSGPRLPRWDDALWAACARYRWKDVDVVIAPSGEPGTRRANTAEQLHYWADLAGIGSSDRVLLLTTQIYVPFQEFVGLRLLGLARGCSVSCRGVDPASSVLPPADFSGRSYLQEIRSALLAARELLAAARQVAG
jgi:hypothetical protein